jgi:hypothetical protein
MTARLFPALFPWDFNRPGGGDLAFQASAHQREGGYATAEAVANAILGQTGDAGMMNDRHFADNRPAPVREDRDEAVQPIERRQQLEH